MGADAEGRDSPETREWKPVRLAQERGCACGCGGGAGGQGPGRPRRGCGSAPDADDIAVGRGTAAGERQRLGNGMS